LTTRIITLFSNDLLLVASTAVLESHISLASGLLFDLSPQQIAMCAPNPDACGGTGGCGGATAEIAFDYVAGMSGILEEFQLGYSAYNGQNSACAFDASGATPVATIDGYVKLAENNYTALMNAIAEVGPIAVSVDASSWHSYAGGVFNGCDQESPDINHAVVLVGYGEENNEKYWLVRNSWSPKWGEQGYIKILRSDADESNCGTDVTPQDGTACAGDNDPVKVCGTCGILYDSAYPTGASIV
jgi:cathepsin L